MRAWWQRRTLRFRIALWYAVGGTVLLAAFSATLYTYVASTMAKPLAEELRKDLGEIRTRLTITDEGAIRWDGAPVPAEVQWRSDDPWFELWDEQGQLVRRLWPFTENRLNRLPAAPARGAETLSVFRVAPDVPLRVFSTPLAGPEAKTGWMIRVMRIHEPIADALGALQLIIFVALPVVVALLVIGGYVITRRWLVPLDRMVAAAEQIQADDLSRRLPVENDHDELGRLAGVFNVTLDRLEASFRTLDRFVADASHELRTPLTTLRSVGEVGLRRSRTVEEYREIIGSMLEEAQRLQLLIQRLLELATAEGGSPQVHRSEVKLDDYVAVCVNELGILADYRNQRLLLTAAPGTVRTDPVLLRQALQNLLDNAIKYSPDGATIHIDVRADEHEASIAVTDQGPGISPDHRAQLMERFYRPDSARGRGQGGFGLGLAITKAYMRVLGGTLQHEPAQPLGSTFRLTLPRN